MTKQTALEAVAGDRYEIQNAATLLHYRLSETDDDAQNALQLLEKAALTAQETGEPTLWQNGVRVMQGSQWSEWQWSDGRLNRSDAHIASMRGLAEYAERALFTHPAPAPSSAGVEGSSSHDLLCWDKAAGNWLLFNGKRLGFVDEDSPFIWIANMCGEDIGEYTSREEARKALIHAAREWLFLAPPAVVPADAPYLIGLVQEDIEKIPPFSPARIYPVEVLHRLSATAVAGKEVGSDAAGSADSEREGRQEEMLEALAPFAEAAREFTCTIGPDGIDDGVAVECVLHGRREREAILSTSHFSRARALYQRILAETTPPEAE